MKKDWEVTIRSQVLVSLVAQANGNRMPTAPGWVVPGVSQRSLGLDHP